MKSDPGDYIGGGQTYKYTPKNATIDVRGTVAGVHASINGANGDWWYADFVPGDGDVIAPGTYKHATRYPFNGTGPGLSVDGNGRGCNTLTGSFTVTQAVFSPSDGTLQRFAVTFVQHCEGGTPALRGTLKFNAALDITPPARVSGLTAIRSGTKINATWTNPTTADYAYTVVRGLPGSTAPATSTVGRSLFSGTGTAATADHAWATAPYSLSVFTVDTSGNVGSAVTITVP
jgi:hypothetical protein